MGDNTAVNTPDPATPAPDAGTLPAAAAKAGVLSGLDGVAAFLEVFDVEESCSVTDLTGATHHFAPVASARRTLRAARLIRRMLDGQPASVETDVLAEMESGGQAGAMSTLLGRLVDDEENEAQIHKLFETLHGRRYDPEQQKMVPGLLASLQKSAKAAELEDPDCGPATNVLDMLDAAEVVEALLPFLPHLASRFAVTVRKVADRAR